MLEDDEGRTGVTKNKVAQTTAPTEHSAAIAFYNRIRRVGSQRTTTPGSGAGIYTKSDGLVGAGVSLSNVVVHFGIQIEERVLPIRKR